MFSDRATVYVRAGQGGAGAVAFRREKYVPKGGPSGGDGGDGGDVILVADANLRDLASVRFHPHLRAEPGRNGEGSNRSGREGAGRRVPVPIGTQVFEESGRLVCDLTRDRAEAVIAHGGRGGLGNARFATPTRQAPRVAELGEEGEELTLDLRLKLLADAALLGFPNVGKSSLLRRISNATPKVADYPFTTIDPVLGTVEGPGESQLTVVDVPGLLEGASDGIGLGHEFLAHLERARLLVHVVDAGWAAEDLDAAREGFDVIYRELVQHGHELAERPRIVVLNKIDLLAPEDRGPLVEAFSHAIAEGAMVADRTVVRGPSGDPVVLGTSCATGDGIAELIVTLHATVPPLELPAEIEPGAELVDFLVYRPVSQAERRRIRVFRDEEGYRVIGEGTPEEIERVLRAAGVRDGAVVTIGGEEYEYHRTQHVARADFAPELDEDE